jgi:hypothetical protein
MDTHHTPPTAADVAAEAGSLSTGFGVLMPILFPLALPGLLLTIPFVLPLVPLLLVPLAFWLLARILRLPVGLVRALVRRWSPAAPETVDTRPA